jgi:cytoskeletal protein CcmA (bactofilin family)
MFNRDGLFGKKDETPARNDVRPVNVTPGLSGAAPVTRPQQAEPPKPDLRFTEPAPTAAAKTAPRTEEQQQPTGSRLIVGPDIKLKGVEITDCDTLVVEGRVEASMDSRVVQIADNGVFSGNVSIDIAEIRGQFEGELTARKQLVIYSTGRVSGRIRYGKIRIEEGGEVSGDVATLGSVAITPRAQSTSGTQSYTPTGSASTSYSPASSASDDEPPVRSTKSSKAGASTA